MQVLRDLASILFSYYCTAKKGKGKGKDVDLYIASHVQDTFNAHLRH